MEDIVTQVMEDIVEQLWQAFIWGRLEREFVLERARDRETGRPVACMSDIWRVNKVGKSRQRRELTWMFGVAFSCPNHVVTSLSSGSLWQQAACSWFGYTSGCLLCSALSK